MDRHGSNKKANRLYGNSEFVDLVFVGHCKSFVRKTNVTRRAETTRNRIERNNDICAKRTKSSNANLVGVLRRLLETLDAMEQLESLGRKQ